jgi:hypothetical protein
MSSFSSRDLASLRHRSLSSALNLGPGLDAGPDGVPSASNNWDLWEHQGGPVRCPGAFGPRASVGLQEKHLAPVRHSLWDCTHWALHSLPLSRWGREGGGGRGDLGAILTRVPGTVRPATCLLFGSRSVGWAVSSVLSWDRARSPPNSEKSQKEGASVDG